MIELFCGYLVRLGQWFSLGGPILEKDAFVLLSAQRMFMIYFEPSHFKRGGAEMKYPEAK